MIRFRKIKTSNLFFLSSITISFLLAIFIQSQFFINHDVAWLVEASRRFLAGGSYTKDFFENNPPMILYLYIPPVLLSKFFSLNIVLSVRIYVFFLALFSLYLCYDLGQRIFPVKHSWLSKLFLVMLAVLFLDLPFYNFGQREHLLLLLTMPYFLLAIYQLEGHSVKTVHAFFIGILAGLGFAIKPYFIFTFFLVELYYCYCQRSLFSWVRSDFFAITSVLVTYIILVFLLNADYLFVVMPYAMHWCYLGSKTPWVTVLNIGPVLFCLAAIVFYWIQFKWNPYQRVGSVLVIALTGFLISYVLQRVNYSYHLLPAFSLALLIFVFYYALQVAEGAITKSRFIVLSLYFVTFYGLLFFYYVTTYWIFLFFHPWLYFGLFALIFSFLFYFTPHKIIDYSPFKMAMVVLFAVVAGTVFTTFLRSTELVSHRFLMTTLFILFIFGVFVSRLNRKRWEPMFVGVLGLLIFAFPLWYYAMLYSQFNSQQENLKNLVTLMRLNASKKTIYFLSTGNFAFPFAGYAEARSVSRFSSFWMLGALVKQPYLNKNVQAQQQVFLGKNVLINMVAEDLNEKKPDLVFVDVESSKGNLFFVKIINGKNQMKRVVLDHIPFNYLNYFSQNINFSNAWKSYYYLTTLSLSSKPFVAVYKRRCGQIDKPVE